MGIYDVEWFQQLRTKITTSMGCMHANQCTQIEAAVVNSEEFLRNSTLAAVLETCKARCRFVLSHGTEV
jgi:hypothetical protein